MQNKLYIGVVGGRDESEEVLRLAEDVGYEIAQCKAVLVCGGHGGVMEAACRGAKNGGGETIGILPGDDRNAANPYVDTVIPTGIGVARNAIIINTIDGIVAVGGKYGTLSEIAFALQKGIPIVALKSWQIDETILTADSPIKAIKLLFDKITVSQK